jgi:CubicO group peptidase (beta-lactamase class C family)
MKYFLLLLIPLSCFAQDNIEKKIDPLLQSGKEFSGVVLVADKGKPVYYKAWGYRNHASKTPLQKTDVFELASVSKQFTAMIIMMLKEKGQLGYDDLVEKYLDIPYKNISIRHLLTHTSGLPDYQAIMDKYWDKSKIASNQEILEYLNKYAPPKLFEPGEKYEYSNTGYVLLASIAEKASGRDFIDMCRQWIFRPLKMLNTDIRTLQQKASTPNFAIGHIYVSEKQRFIRADSFPSSDYTIWLGNRKGPGRISSTAADLLKWDQALYSNKLVKPTTLAEAFSPMKLKNDSLSNYGFGWDLVNSKPVGKVVMHTGDNPGYATRIVRYIDRNKTIIILSNNAFTGQAELVRKMEAIIF